MQKQGEWGMKSPAKVCRYPGGLLALISILGQKMGKELAGFET